MKALVFDLETGEILREMRGKVPLERQRVGNGRGVVANDIVARPDHIETLYAPVSIPDDLEGQKVDTATGEIVTDPNYSAPRTAADIAEDLRAGNLTTEEALLEVLER